MRKLAIIFILVCTTLNSVAQTNFVKNPSFEDLNTCPEDWNQVSRAKYWTNAIDTVGEPPSAPECYNSCAVANIYGGLPENIHFYQFARTGNSMVGATLYYDKTLPAPPFVPANYRDYFQGRLHSPLKSGKTYCVSYWVNLMESSAYAHDKIGVYFDNGSINLSGRLPGEEITTLVPQVFSMTKILDTANWTKIEGSFIATGNETHLTIGVFVKNSDLDIYSVPYYAASIQYSYYLFDDISVVPVDLSANAGKDSHAELGKKALIGRVGDTTALGLDCKWYKKGVLIDSGAIISVNAGASVGKIDTYVVVQTVCGLVKTDTVTVKTVPVGFKEYNKELSFSVYPNPSSGALTITTLHALIPLETLHAKVYNLLGRVVYQNQVSFSNNQASILLNVVDGVYILELMDTEGNATRLRVEIRN